MRVVINIAKTDYESLRAIAGKLSTEKMIRKIIKAYLSVQKTKTALLKYRKEVRK